jgi:ectoine hydroxylase-related dioxygenase (phytanoyl-CoA dioxygenase family)
MPGHRKISCAAGTSMIFDLRTWHAAFPNTSDLERRCLILSYTPFWHKVSCD